jgi:hypothetical protein
LGGATEGECIDCAAAMRIIRAAIGSTSAAEDEVCAKAGIETVAAALKMGINALQDRFARSSAEDAGGCAAPSKSQHRKSRGKQCSLLRPSR